VNNGQTSLPESMFEKWGPLLTLAQLAGILNRSTDGVRLALRESSPYTDRLNAARVRIGRRIYFRTIEVAQILLAAD
jgi:hypothetical protein